MTIENEEQRTIETPGKKPYKTPELKDYGQISELVLSQPRVGPDGAFFNDDTAS